MTNTRKLSDTALGLLAVVADNTETGGPALVASAIANRYDRSAPTRTRMGRARIVKQLAGSGHLSSTVDGRGFGMYALTDLGRAALVTAAE